ncbi:MAG: hypothetical protein P4M11_14590 [Candidatus Pacebacteria bacterium]|nr:hypothetical protein [Candidatus Paceibacterota bacterium]
MKVLVPLALSRDAIRRLFEHISHQLGFRVIDRGEGFMTAVQQPRFSLQKLLCCFEDSLGSDRASAVKLEMETDERAAQRVVTVRGLTGVSCDA